LTIGVSQSFLWFFIADNKYKLWGYECMILSPTSLEKETEGGYEKSADSQSCYFL